MKRLTITLATLAGLLLTAPVMAETGFYIGGSIGSTLLNDSTVKGDRFDPQSNTFTEIDSDIEFDPGVNAAFALGYDVGSYFSHDLETGGRIEFELGYSLNDVDRVDDPGRVLRESGGDVEVISLMLNSYADFRIDSPLVPYVTAGLGGAQVTFNDLGIDDNDDTVFAWQVGAGLSYPAFEHLIVDLGYRYFATSDIKFEALDGSRIETEYDSHNITLGMRVPF